jgi:hypothetical protein
VGQILNANQLNELTLVGPPWDNVGQRDKLDFNNRGYDDRFSAKFLLYEAFQVDP